MYTYTLGTEYQGNKIVSLVYHCINSDDLCTLQQYVRQFAVAMEI